MKIHDSLEERVQLQKAYNAAFGRIMNQKRERAGVSQGELGEMLGVNKSTVSRYEKGTTEIPAGTLPLTCEVCDFKMHDYVVAVEDLITEKKLLEIYKTKERSTMPKDVSDSGEEHYTEAEKQLVDLSYDYLLKLEQMGPQKNPWRFQQSWF